MLAPCWITLLCGQHRRAFSRQVIRQERGKVSFTDALSYFGIDIRPLPFSKRSSSLAISAFFR